MKKEMNIFEVATRDKYRFPYRGMISVEDLWDLPLVALDSIYKTLNKQMKQSQEESLLHTKSKEDERLEIAIEIVKYIVSVKQQEASDRAKEKERKEQRERIMEVMAERQDKALKEKSDEELQKMLEELQ